MENHWLSPEEIAERYGVPLATIYGWRTKGYGPRGVKIGRHVRYPADEVERWEQELLKAAGTAA